MIEDNPNKQEEQVNTKSTINAILCYAWWPIVGMLFHPMYTIINAAVVGRFDNEIYLAALGLGSLTIGILLISIVTCFCMVVGSFVAPAWGDNRPDLAKRYLYRQYVLNTIVYAICLVPVFFIEPIFIFIG